MSDTPETDAVFLIDGNFNTFAKTLKRERDEAKTELEMWRDGNIMHQIHRDELEKAERERNHAWELAHRYRSLYYTKLGIENSASWFPWERHNE